VDWQQVRLVIAVVAGTGTLWAGVRQNEPAMMTVGAGLIGFSPAASGPSKDEPKAEPSKLVVP
jgi:hypothetical protein